MNKKIILTILIISGLILLTSSISISSVSAAEPKEIIDQYTIYDYWKTIQSKGNTYKYYKIIEITEFDDESVKKKQIGTKKAKIITVKKKVKVSAWDLEMENYDNGYVKVSQSKKCYSNGVMKKVYDPRSNRYYYNMKASTPKFNFKASEKNVKITKVNTKSYHVHYAKSDKFTIKNPKKTKWYKPKKLYTFWSFTVYYQYKDEKWVS